MLFRIFSDRFILSFATAVALRVIVVVRRFRKAAEEDDTEIECVPRRPIAVVALRECVEGRGVAVARLMPSDVAGLVAMGMLRDTMLARGRTAACFMVTEFWCCDVSVTKKNFHHQSHIYALTVI